MNKERMKKMTLHKKWRGVKSNRQTLGSWTRITQTWEEIPS